MALAGSDLMCRRSCEFRCNIEIGLSRASAMKYRPYLTRLIARLPLPKTLSALTLILLAMPTRLPRIGVKDDNEVFVRNCLGVVEGRAERRRGAEAITTVFDLIEFVNICESFK